MKKKNILFLLTSMLLVACDDNNIQIKPIELPAEAQVKVTVDDATKVSYVTFGSYQQTRVYKEVDNKALDLLQPDEDGFYTYNDKTYVKRTGKSYDSKCRYYNNNEFIDTQKKDAPLIKNPMNSNPANADAYFEVEPLKWQVADYSNGVYTLICDKIIYTSRFDDDSNVYADSEVKNWLNNEFKNAAFSATEASYIVGDIEIPTADLLNKDYVLSSTRISDYAASFGAQYLVNDSTNKNWFCGYYWTMDIDQSANSNPIKKAGVVVPQGYKFNYMVNIATFGFRPVIKVNTLI